MRMLFAAGVALATGLASPAFAASHHRHAPAAHEASPYAMAGAGTYAPRSDVVTFGNRIVGEDPDLNIRSQLIRDPALSEN